MNAGIKQKFFGLVGKFRRKLKNRADRILARFKSTEEVFTRIYTNNEWGGAAGEICSGGGSTDEAAAAAYVEMILSQSQARGFKDRVFVDLGCGDMRIGARLIPHCRSYIGVDIVKYVVDRHQAEMGSDRVGFRHLDIIADDLPDGDVCFIRQVIQHLSNKQILGILPKLRKYQYVYITEHVPSDAAARIPNIDKPHGKGIRLDRNSGVDITQKPFNIPKSEVITVLEIRGNEVGQNVDPGLIRTVLYTPSQ